MLLTKSRIFQKHITNKCAHDRIVKQSLVHILVASANSISRTIGMCGMLPTAVMSTVCTYIRTIRNSDSSVDTQHTQFRSTAITTRFYDSMCYGNDSQHLRSIALLPAAIVEPIVLLSQLLLLPLPSAVSRMSLLLSTWPSLSTPFSGGRSVMLSVLKCWFSACAQSPPVDCCRSRLAFGRRSGRWTRRFVDSRTNVPGTDEVVCVNGVRVAIRLKHDYELEWCCEWCYVDAKARLNVRVRFLCRCRRSSMRKCCIYFCFFFSRSNKFHSNFCEATWQFIVFENAPLWH